MRQHLAESLHGPQHVSDILHDALIELAYDLTKTADQASKSIGYDHPNATTLQHLAWQLRLVAEHVVPESHDDDTQPH